MKNKSLKYLTKISVLSVIAAVLMLFEFPLPFAPSFYKLDFSEIAVLISGFALGPAAGVITEFLKILLNLIMNGTATAFVGEISNFSIGVAFVLPASLVYKYRKNLSGAIIGMVAGTLSLTVLGALINYYVMVPAYAKFFMPMEVIVGLGNKVNGRIDSLLSLILLATVPFNFLKGVLCSLLTALIYKKVSPILHK